MPPRPPPPPAPSSFVPHPPPDAAFDPFADEEAQFQMALQLSLQAASGKVNAQSSATEAERPGDITAISPSDDKPSRAADTLMTSLPKEIVSSILKCARWLLELEKPVKKKPVRSNPTRNLVTQRPNVRAMNAQSKSYFQSDQSQPLTTSRTQDGCFRFDWSPASGMRLPRMLHGRVCLSRERTDRCELRKASRKSCCVSHADFRDDSSSVVAERS